MSDVKAGYLAKVEISSGNQVLGAGTWSYTGENRDIHESTHFDTTGYKIDTPLMIAGGEITVSGDFRLADAAGRDAIDTAFQNGTELRDFRLYVDQTSYYIPDSSLFATATVVGSYVTITKAPSTATFDTAGVGTMEFTAKVTGRLTLINAAANITIKTLGRVEDPRLSDAMFIGDLTSMGSASDNSDVSFKFRYGTDKNVLNSETETRNISDLGVVGIWQSDLTAAKAVLYYQAVATGVDDGTKVGVGAIISDAFHST